MSLVSTIFNGVGYRIGGGLTISATSDPTSTVFLQWMNETAQWITGICAENDSDLGRTIGTITTLTPAITVIYPSESPTIFTAVGHGLDNNDEILIKNSDFTELNDHEWTFTKISGTSGSVPCDTDAHSGSVYGTSGDIYKRKYSTIATSLYCPAQTGWIVNGRARDELILRTEKELIDYDPCEASEPDAFYVDGSNNICFFVYPDAAYTVKIPYWTLPTVLTATGDTVPFLGLMDNVFIEALSLRYFERDEYDASYELKWQSFLLERIRRVIEMRKKMTSRVTT
jgi:hypothetical protein